MFIILEITKGLSLRISEEVTARPAEVCGKCSIAPQIHRNEIKNTVIRLLGENNQVLISWIPAHSGFKSNKHVDIFAKRRANNTNATFLKLPNPKATWDAAIRKRTKHSI